MTILEAYRAQIRKCKEKEIKYESGHYETRIDFEGKDVFVNPDGSPVVRYKFNITGCMKSRLIERKRDGKKVMVHFHKDKLPVFGTITKRAAFKKFLYKYMLFLRCDGIEDRDLILLYVLHCMNYKFEFWRREKVGGEYKDWETYTPEYEDVQKMISGLIDSALKKNIDDRPREQFIERTCCVVNPTVKDKFGGIKSKTNREKHWDAKRGQRVATDNRIRAMYDPTLTNKENAQRIGIGVRRLQEWKSDNKDLIETLEQRIQRMYDHKLSPGKNAEMIGCSVNSVKKYAPEVKEVVEGDEMEDWVSAILEENTSEWESAPAPTRKKSFLEEEEERELDELLKDIDLDF